METDGGRVELDCGINVSLHNVSGTVANGERDGRSIDWCGGWQAMVSNIEKEDGGSVFWERLRLHACGPPEKFGKQVE